MKTNEPTFPSQKAVREANWDGVGDPPLPKGEGEKTKLWGGAFSKAPADVAWKFGQSIESDIHLWCEEIDVSIAHAKMLAASGIIDKADGKKLVKALEELRRNDPSHSTHMSKSAHILDAEDLHGAIEALLVEMVGDVAKRLHAGRSRNDQIVTVTRLWLKRKGVAMMHAIASTQQTLLELAEKHADDPMPGYTHMQPAQPITLGFHLLAHFWMLERDKKRFEQVIAMADESPLGAAALAGTSLPIDRGMTAKELGFAAPMANALDAVSDRDFVGDALHACATLMQHLSRVSQEIVLFSTAEYGYAMLDEAYSTGSSIMPQKRNPDMAELIRGRSGRAIGHWTAFMSMMKGQPLGYNRDLQEDKPPLFDSIALCLDSLVLVREMLATMTFNLPKMAERAGEGFSTATGLAEALVKQGIPFRTAHELVGEWVRKGGSASIPGFQPGEVEALTSVAGSLAARDSQGAPGRVAMQVQFECAWTSLTGGNIGVDADATNLGTIGETPKPLIIKGETQ